MAVLAIIVTNPALAHCDSYDEAVITDAKKALERNNVDFVLKWVFSEQGNEIILLFRKTVELKKATRKSIPLLKNIFCFHREIEGAPYTGLKSAGTTKTIFKMSENALNSGDINKMTEKLYTHIGSVVRSKYEKAASLSKIKDEFTVTGRQFVKAYVDYNHTLEVLHDILEHGVASHSGH